MGLILYSIFTKAYFLLISISALFSKKARLFKRGRKDLFAKLQADVSLIEGDIIWFHCASLGEFEQGRPIIEAFKKEFKEYKILLTFFSPSGYEVRKNYKEADLIFYLPEDSAANAKRFLDIVQPKLVIFVKYEFWYFFLREIHLKNIPLISTSSIFRDDQFFFKPYGVFYRDILKGFNHFFVQDENSKKLLEKIGISQVSVAGDTRFDRVYEIAQNKKTLPEINQFKKHYKVFIAGSIWQEDLEVIVPLVHAFPEIKFILAPHEISEHGVGEIVKRLPNSSRYTKKINNNQQVLIIDNIGLLSSLYQFADYAYIGGAFGKGLHNILEAATFGMPIFFGNKNYEKFAEAVNLIKQGGAFPVENYEEIKIHLLNFEQQPQKRKAVGIKNKKFVEDNRGSTEKIVAYSKNILSV